MATRDELDEKYKMQHRELEASYYEHHKITKEAFDQQHGQLWDNHRQELIDAGLIQPPEPARDLEAEIDDLKSRLAKLER